MGCAQSVFGASLWVCKLGCVIGALEEGAVLVEGKLPWRDASSPLFDLLS